MNVTSISQIFVLFCVLFTAKDMYVCMYIYTHIYIYIYIFRNYKYIFETAESATIERDKTDGTCRNDDLSVTDIKISKVIIKL